MTLMFKTMKNHLMTIQITKNNKMRESHLLRNLQQNQVKSLEVVMRKEKRKKRKRRKIAKMSRMTLIQTKNHLIIPLTQTMVRNKS